MFDQTKTVTLTGVTYQFVAQANHAELHFFVLGPDGKLQKGKDGKNVDYGIEMAGAAAVAQQGITATTFPAGTIFSVEGQPDARRLELRFARRRLGPGQVPLEEAPGSRQGLRQRRRAPSSWAATAFNEARRSRYDDMAAARRIRAAVFLRSLWPNGGRPSEETPT